jgi:hypothetical protein
MSPGCVQVQLSSLDNAHDRVREDRLAERVRLEDGIDCDELTTFSVRKAESLRPNRLTAPVDRHREPWDACCRHYFGRALGQSGQLLFGDLEVRRPPPRRRETPNVAANTSPP